MFVSDFFELNETQYVKMRSKGVFDAVIDKDSGFYINIIRLKQSKIPEFVEAYQHINRFFSDIATLLDVSEQPSRKDKFYRSARNKFVFHEVNEINLGGAKSKYGRGWGEQLSNQFLQDAYQIVKKGSKQPEIFHLVSLFEEDVGPDRLSDMIATIIMPEIIKYTLRLMKELEITPLTRSALSFLGNGLVKNPYKKVPILLLPEEILHEMPIAKGWDDIDRAISENNVIRQEISKEIGDEWSRWASSEKKAYLKQHVFMDPETCARVVNGYKKEDIEIYNVKENTEYLIELLLRKFKESGLLLKEIDRTTSLAATKEIIGIFKDWVENNRGWAEIQDSPTSNREKAVQRFMHLGAKFFVEEHDLDLSFEPNEGSGPTDIKISRGNDKTIAEIKLSSNAQYLHGYETQIQKYAVSERTVNMIYVFIDVGNVGRRKKIAELYEETKNSRQPYPELIIIDACPKQAASTIKENLYGLNWESIEKRRWNNDSKN